MRRREFLKQAAVSAASLSAASNVLAMAGGSNPSQGPSNGLPIRVGSKKQLFIDDRFFREKHGVKLVVNRPVLTGERCIVADKPWEGFAVLAYNSVMDDEGTLKMWYDAIANDGSRWCCYATSHDGVHWEKPNLGIVPFHGRDDTNIVFPPRAMTHEPNCVFKDTNPACPDEERYKMVCSLHPPGRPNGTYVAASPDGLHWKLLKDSPAFRPSDTNNICFFDDRIGRYVGYVRVWNPLRKVGRCTFDQITDWGKEQIVFSYDDEDERSLDKGLFSAMDFYTSAAWKYPLAENIYLLFPSAYYHYRVDVARRMGSDDPKNDGPLDIQFATSRDGVHWNRLNRRPFIHLGETGHFDSSYAYMASGCVLRPDEIWLYYATSTHTHGNYNMARDKFTGTITRARLRLDGYVSVDGDYTGGEFTTPPLVFAGAQLNLNVDTSAGGTVRVEVQQPSGKALEGFSVGDCKPINGNFIQRRVSWQGRDGLGALAGKPIRLRFLIRDAKLFAFQFQET